MAPREPVPTEPVPAALVAPPAPLADAVAALPSEPGLLAWWAPPSVLPAVGGAPHPDGARRCLDVDAATMLRNRVTRRHLYRSGVSPLRRVLAGLMLDELSLAPTWAADVVLPRADEERLTAWMREHLTLTFHVDDDRDAILPAVLAELAPGLAPGGETARAAQERFVAAAGAKTARVLGVPFRRP